MLRRALRHPLGRGRRLDVLAVGGALHLATAWVPLLPLVPVLGYLLRVLETTAAERRSVAEDDGESDVPGFESPGRLLLEGSSAALVIAVYMALPLALLLIAVRGPVDAPTGSPDTATAVAFLALSTATLLLALAAASLLPAALTNLATTGRFRAAFDAGVLRRAVTDGEYVVAVLFGVALLGAGTGIARALTDWVVGFFLAFYVEVATAALVGRASGRAVHGDREPAAEADGDSAVEKTSGGRGPQDRRSNSSR